MHWMRATRHQMQNIHPRYKLTNQFVLKQASPCSGIEKASAASIRWSTTQQTKCIQLPVSSSGAPKIKQMKHVKLPVSFGSKWTLEITFWHCQHKCKCAVTVTRVKTNLRCSGTSLHQKLSLARICRF
jgi:hypothetical protein